MINLVADVVKFDGEKLLNYEPVLDHFVVEIPDVNLFVEGSKTIRKTEKQVAEEMDKVLGEYFKVVAVGPECKILSIGDNVFMIPPNKCVSFKAPYVGVDTDDLKPTTFKRFAIFKEYVVLGKLSVSE
jgi:hypothetical protein